MEHTHVGIDISKDTFNAAYCEGMSKWHEQSFSNSNEGRRKLLKWVSGKDVVFTMEATGYYHLETALFLQRSHKVFVSNPMLVKRFSQMRLQRGKTDRADAKMIADYSSFNEGELRSWEPADGLLGEARALLTVAKQLQQQITQSQNSIHALKQTEAGRSACASLVSLLRTQRTLLRKTEKSIMDAVKAEHGEMLNAIQSIPGVGPKTAAGLIVCTNGFRHFTNHKQVCAYVGLSPRVYESGTSVKGKGRICKLGNPYLRRCLYLCAVSAMTCNPMMKEYKKSLTDRGKHNKVALVAVANKLLKVAFAIAKSGQRWHGEVPKN